MAITLSGDNGITFPNSTIQASAGQILQVVNATYSVDTTNNTSTVADTGLTATITPKFSTSKILVIVNQQGCQKRTGNAASGLTLYLYRNSSSLVKLQQYGGYTDTNSYNYFASIGGNYLDTPATTSATSYKTMFVNEVNGAGVSVQGNTSTSTITLLEIAQ